ncbi:Abhydrolase domain containing [Nesidiocoris tenuis]|uniref:Abhydrolase domain containing n=1 Tax=Nesidiocoris tenuis TaxID=355587 RepID=A0ABN7ACA4_9HEMI|nr:Abhydrolase domain containing [Nesidiocoris tenuis]
MLPRLAHSIHPRRVFRRLIMKVLYKKKLMRRIAVGTLVTLLLVIVFIFVVIPIVFKYTPSIQKMLLFLNSVNIPVDFKRPGKFVPGSRNTYVRGDGEISLGVWQILPKNLAPDEGLEPASEQFDKLLSNGEPVFIYMHGNSGNRGTSHRIDLYKVLQNNNYHVIAFDYRSYGDSGKGELSEMATVNDSMAIYKWTKERTRGNAKIFFWGHSLGTGISSHLLHVLESRNETVAGLILEAPFNNLEEEMRNYPLAQIWRFLPWFDYFFTEPVHDNNLRYESDVHLTQVKAPILILHAEDDIVIPIQLSRKLYEKIVSSRGQGTVDFKSYPSDRHYGHKFIVRDKKLPEVIDEFVKRSIAIQRS